MVSRTVAGRIRLWVPLIVLVVALSVALTLVGSPSPVLFGALCAGLVYALSMAEPPTVPALAVTTGQAILGASIGAFFDPNILTWLRDDWAPVIGVSVGTLALSVLVGFVLRLHPGVSAVTGTFAMVAGGASGIVALARELGADDRIVPVVQYLRVLVIIIGMPLVAHVLIGLEPEMGGYGSLSFSFPEHILVVNLLFTEVVVLSVHSLMVNVLFTVVCVVVGLVLARRIALPAASLLFPLFVAALISWTGIVGSVEFPVTVSAGILYVGFALIGLQVGLRFTRASLKAVAKLFPWAIAPILGLMAACAALGALLAWATGHSQLDGYLATTPGGLYAVLATAIYTGADVTFILTVQLARLLVIFFSAPLLAGWLAPRAEPKPTSAV